MQTLLKTTHHILVHDVRGSLANLRSLVQKAVTPQLDLCVVCSRRAESLADGSKDDVVVFRYNATHHIYFSCIYLDMLFYSHSCGHLYHASCLGISGSSPQTLAACCIVCNKTAAPKTSRLVKDTVSFCTIIFVCVYFS